VNRTGLAIALAVAAGVGVVFAIFPQLDLELSGFFFDPKTNTFPLALNAPLSHARGAAQLLITLLAAPAILAVVGKVLVPHRPMLIPGRAALLLLTSLALGPGILANTILKDHWGRARPIDIVAFGGNEPFTPWFDPRGSCSGNCSFVAGEPSGAFWAFAPAALSAPQWRLLAYGSVLAFGAAVGLLRMAVGAHFFTDVVFAGVVIFLLVWTLHGLIYRWRATRLTDMVVEDPLGRAGRAMRDVGGAVARRIGRRRGESS
jgi:lipid A 4'-phosphatase